MTAEEFEKHKQEWRAEIAALDTEIAAIKRELQPTVQSLAIAQRQMSANLCCWSRIRVR
jgi:hypothetical protein